MVKSAVRTVTILGTLASAGRALTHSEIAEALGIPPSSLSALLRDLIELRYVDVNTETRKYSLGPGVLALSSAYLRGLDIGKLAEPALLRLFEQVREFTALVIPNGTEATKVREHAVADPLASHLQLGESGPMHVTACGKAILAFTSADRQRQIIRDMEMRIFTKYTISSKEKLVEELARIRATGISYCREEYVEGTISMGAPVFDATEEAIAAIGVNTRTVRFTKDFEDSTRPLLVKAVSELSARLGSVSATTVFDAKPAGRARRVAA